MANYRSEEWLELHRPTALKALLDLHRDASRFYSSNAIAHQTFNYDLKSYPYYIPDLLDAYVEKKLVRTKKFMIRGKATAFYGINPEKIDEITKHTAKIKRGKLVGFFLRQ